MDVPLGLMVLLNMQDADKAVFLMVNIEGAPANATAFKVNT